MAAPGRSFRYDIRVSSRKRKLFTPQAVALGILLCATFALRTFQLDSISLTSDEFLSAVFDPHATWADFWALYWNENPDHVPLYFLLQFAWADYIGAAVAVQRLFPVLVGCLTLLPVYFMARRFHSAGPALVAVGFLALSGAQIEYSQTLRPYSFTLFFAALSLWVYCRALEGTDRRWWVANWAFNALLMLTHVSGAFFLLAQGLFLLFARPLKTTAAWGGASALTLLPWLLTVSVGRLATMGMLSPPTLRDTFAMVAGESANQLACFRAAEIGRAGLLSATEVALALGLVAAASIAAWRVARAREGGRPLALALIFALVPAFAVHAAALSIAPMLHTRHGIVAALGTALLCGAGVAALRAPALRWALALLLLVPLAVQFAILDRAVTGPDFLGATEIIAQRPAVGAVDVVVINFGEPADYSAPQMVAQYLGLPQTLVLGPERARAGTGTEVRAVHTHQAALDLAARAPGWATLTPAFWVVAPERALGARSAGFAAAFRAIGLAVEEFRPRGILLLRCQAASGDTLRPAPLFATLDTDAVLALLGYTPSDVDDARRAARALRHGMTHTTDMDFSGDLPANIALHIAAEHPRLALAIAEKGDALHPGLTPYYLAAGFAHIAQGDRHTAHTLFEEVLARAERGSLQLAPVLPALLAADWSSYSAELDTYERRRHLLLPVLRRIAVLPTRGPVRPEDFD